MADVTKPPVDVAEALWSRVYELDQLCGAHHDGHDLDDAHHDPPLVAERARRKYAARMSAAAKARPLSATRERDE